MSGAANELTTLPPALTCARLLRESQDLINRGLGDSPEAESLADQMDKPWYAMTDQEEQRMRELSVDLYALYEGAPKRIEMPPNQLAEWQEEMKSAWRQSDLGDVDAALKALRKPIPSKLPDHIIPFLQAKCWEKLGDLETASLFMKEAERRNSGQPLSVLAVLQQLGIATEKIKPEGQPNLSGSDTAASLPGDGFSLDQHR